MPPRGKPVHILLSFALIPAPGLPGPMTRQLACKGSTGGLQAGEDGHDALTLSPLSGGKPSLCL
eukprot:5502788-Pyramimonas_sp.AAC.2